MSCGVEDGGISTQQAVVGAASFGTQSGLSYAPWPPSQPAGVPASLMLNSYMDEVTTRKWCLTATQGTAARQSGEQLLLTRVNLQLWSHWVVAKLRTVINISFVIKWGGVLDKLVRTKKNGTFNTTHFCVQLSSAWLLGLIWVSLITKALKEEG